MESLKYKNRKFMMFAILSAFLFVWLITGSGMAANQYIKLIGTLLPADQQHDSNVYALQYGDQSWYLGITDVRTNTFSPYALGNDWSALTRSAIGQFRLIGDKDTIKPLNVMKMCEPIAITGFIDYNTGRLRVIDVEPTKSPIELAWCTY
ncbi:MAG: hypothetical protein RBT11_04795 [Desulfobacterales bacterium]|jgi:hypothetical protein|nr:hypothetical protein [Desulfobacterales bacterium]